MTGSSSSSLPRYDLPALKAANPPEAVLPRLGMAYKRVGSRLATPCPGCGKTDKFDVAVSGGAHNCFTCDVSGGDIIALVQTVRGCDFIAACQWLGGDAPISADEKARLDRLAKDNAAKAAAAVQAKAVRDAADMKEIIKGCQPAAGTVVEGYLRGRHLGEALLKLGWLDADGSAVNWPRDICFHPGLPAYAGGKGARFTVGTFPAMIMFGRKRSQHPGVQGDIVVVHRTFLAVHDDHVTKVRPGRDFDLAREDFKTWNAKQMVGSLSACDAGVYLGGTNDITDNPLAPDLAGEGMESVLSVAAAGVSGNYHAALSLSRLTGSTTKNAAGNYGFSFADNGRPKIILADNDFSETLAFPDDPEQEGMKAFGGYRRARHEFGKAETRLRKAEPRTEIAWPYFGHDFNTQLISSVSDVNSHEGDLQTDESGVPKSPPGGDEGGDPFDSHTAALDAVDKFSPQQKQREDA